jgi:hypothetical protein
VEKNDWDTHPVVIVREPDTMGVEKHREVLDVRVARSFVALPGWRIKRLLNCRTAVCGDSGAAYRMHSSS